MLIVCTYKVVTHASCLYVKLSVCGWRYVCLYFFIFICGLMWCLIVHMVVWCLSGVCLSVDGTAALCICGGMVWCLSVDGAAAVCTGNGVVSVCGCVLSF
jgi:hypothetical protein